MPVTKKKKKTTPISTLPEGTTTSPSTTSSDPPAGASAPTVTSTAAPPAPLASLVNPLPTSVTPTPPATALEISLKEFMGFHPKATQVAIALLVVQELTSSKDYMTRFGGPVPAASTVADAVELAYNWRLVRDAADAWARYVHTQDGFAWKGALTLLDQLEPVFQAAALRDSTVASSYPALTRFFAAPKVAGKAASATKKENAKVKAAKGAAAAAPAATEAPATPARVVTVSG